MKKILFRKPSSKIVFRYCLIALIFILLFALLLPTLLNYPPGSINTEFDVKMSYISYTQQFMLIGTLIILLIFISTKLLLRDIDKWYLSKNRENWDTKKILSIRKKCFNLPYIIFLLEILLPVLGIAFIVFSTGSHHSIMLIKILILVVAILFLMAEITYIFSKSLYDDILACTYTEGINIGFRINLRNKILLQLLPVFISVLLICSYIGFSTYLKEISNIYYNIYNTQLNNAFDKSKNYELAEIENILKNLKINDYQFSKFIITDTNVITVEGDAPSNFMIAYTKELSQNYNGRTYDSYGVDIQGVTIKLNINNSPVYVGLMYSISSKSIINYIIITSILLLLLVLIVLYYFSKSLTKDIQSVTIGLNEICNDLNTTYHSKLPVISNDEFGDLIIAFNNVQALNTSNLQKIQNDQDILVEQERLVSLGQMIGGIAHNLKTPIFSISGGLEGLTDLINEYDESIENKLVTNDDMHAIANDMREWIVKLKDHISYMSDVITAVKGQTVALSETESASFSVSELFKRVDILMKHEIKNSLASLDFENNVPDSSFLYGNINSLVQIMNNIISNAIDAYNINNYSEKPIYISSIQEDGKIIISIKDLGPGISKVAQEKLFKKMITTKGKNGTGLGMFMSYSNIKAHFNGDMYYETTEGKGTTFFISLPIKNI